MTVRYSSKHPALGIAKLTVPFGSIPGGRVTHDQIID